MKEDDKISRRIWLKTAAFAAVSVTVPALAGLTARAADAKKVSKVSVHYQPNPDHGRMCMMCRYFISAGGKTAQNSMGGMSMMGGMMNGKDGSMMAEGTCHLVAGSINPMGYCDLYTPAGK
ncbi:MAG: hypothetical protein ACYDE0_14645 [Acidiferrobacterales bacterium]